MSQTAVTIDFHDTLVHCDPWFELEVRHLPSAFLRWYARESGAWSDAMVGTSVDASYRRLRTAIIQHGHELTAERCLAVVFDRAGLSIPDDAIDRGVHELMSACLPASSLVPGARELVTALSDADVPLGVVSSAVYHPFLEWALERHDIHDRFGVVTTSASCGYYKSRPEIYWLTLRQLAATGTRGIHIGDSARFDVLGARRAGMRTVWLNAKGADPNGCDPDHTVTNLLDAIDPVVSMLAR